MLADRLDAALLALAAGRRRPLLELARDAPGVVAEMAAQFEMSPAAVASDLSMLHAAEFEDVAEALPARYDRALLARAGIGPENSVLDVGCGSGASIRAAARVAVAGTVVGIDVAAPLVKRARERAGAEGLANVTVVSGDATVHPFDPASFDVAISRFGAMYFRHPVPAFANIAAALRPGGRLVLLTWRSLEHNEWMAAIGEALGAGRSLRERPEDDRGAFALADGGTVRAILTEAGYEGIDVEAVAEPVVLGADGGQAYEFVSTLDLARAMLEGLEAPARREALARLRAVLAAHQASDGVQFGSGAWVVTARRREAGAG